MAKNPNYRREAAEAKPVKGECFNCGMAWLGSDSRTAAQAHREATGHATWIECAARDGSWVEGPSTTKPWRWPWQ